MIVVSDTGCNCGVLEADNARWIEAAEGGFVVDAAEIRVGLTSLLPVFRDRSTRELDNERREGLAGEDSREGLGELAADLMFVPFKLWALLTVDNEDDEDSWASLGFGVVCVKGSEESGSATCDLPETDLKDLSSMVPPKRMLPHQIRNIEESLGVQQRNAQLSFANDP